MDFVRLRRKHHADLNFVDFNQDSTYMSVGARNGFRLYRCHPFAKCYQMRGGGIGIVEMLHGTSLIALVGGGDKPAFSPRSLRMWNTKANGPLCEIPFDSVILAVRMNTKRLIVVLENQINIFDINSMTMLQSLETPRNPSGLVAFSGDDANSLLVFPKTNSAGELVVFDAMFLAVKNVIPAHKQPIAALKLSTKGGLLATASERGTLIRVFSMPDGELLHTLRRGSSVASISSLAFSPDERFLVASGSSPTIHIYKLGSKDDIGDMEADKATASSVPSSTSVFSGVLESAMSLGRVMEGERDFARVRVQDGESNCLCAITVSAAAAARPAVEPEPEPEPEAAPESPQVQSATVTESTVLPEDTSTGAGMGAGAGADSGSEPEETKVEHAPPAPGTPGAVVAAAPTPGKNYTVTVAVGSGVLYQYVLDPVKGGDCKLSQMSMLAEAASEAVGATVIP